MMEGSGPLINKSFMLWWELPSIGSHLFRKGLFYNVTTNPFNTLTHKRTWIRCTPDGIYSYKNSIFCQAQIWEAKCGGSALNKWVYVLNVAKAEITSFDNPKELYEGDKYYGELWNSCSMNYPKGNFHLKRGILFKGNQVVYSKNVSKGVPD